MGSARSPLYPPPAWPSPAYSYSTHREASPNVPKDCGDPHTVLAPGLNELEDGKVKVTPPHPLGSQPGVSQLGRFRLAIRKAAQV